KDFQIRNIQGVIGQLRSKLRYPTKLNRLFLFLCSRLAVGASAAAVTKSNSSTEEALFPLPSPSAPPLGDADQETTLQPPEPSSSPPPPVVSEIIMFSRDSNVLFSGGGISFLHGNHTGKFSYGYSSFKGKRASMEDFYETRISEVDGQMVAFFGVFDAIPLSIDHKPDRSDERRRIEDAGGFILWAGTWRVGGILAVSRAFGDKLLKRYVVADPEIKEEEIPSVDFIIIASDGLWNVISNEEAVSLVQHIQDAEMASRKLIQEAYARGSTDNITCVIVQFGLS
ncbi:putative protein phosphatase 2C 11, partial [Cucurbita argyrosperma subsp. argyrosperma]